MDTLLIIFAKEPVPGQVKTRLCPPLSPETVARLYRHFLEDILAEMLTLPRMQVAVAYTPAGARDFFARLAAVNLLLTPQIGTGMGDRLTEAFAWGFSQGYRVVLSRNSDSPDLPGELVLAARETLLVHPERVVLGPNPDGGYYLVGLTRPQPALFQQIPWSTPAVLAETRERARRLNLPVHLLPPWADIDSFADLQRFLEGNLQPGQPGYRSFRQAVEAVQLTTV